MERPETRKLSSKQMEGLGELFSARGHRLLHPARNPYVVFEVRTEGKSIFTLYTSGKIVCTLRAGDAEGAALMAAIGGSAPKALGRGASSGLKWLAGADETGTGELLGTAVVGGALLPVELADALAEVCAHVDTKSSRAASGWEALGESLAGLSRRGLRGVALPIPNRLFDRYSKNALLDLAYVRVVNDLLGAAADPAELELAIDDYGVGALLSRAVEAWRGRGMSVLVTHRADDSHLAARAAAVLARSHRSRQMAALAAEAEDGPLGTGNAGHPQTLAWLRRRAASGLPWPSFVKASFKTVTELDGREPAQKKKVPELDQLMDGASAQAFLQGGLDVGALKLRAGDELVGHLSVDGHGKLIAPAAAAAAWDLLPLISSGIALDDSVRRVELVDELLARETGLLSGWRVLVGPEEDAADPVLVLLARAHRAGIVTVVRTDEKDARRRGGVLLTSQARATQAFHLRLA